MSEHTDDRGPAFRVWPPVSVGVPLGLGLLVSSYAGDPLPASAATTWAGWWLVTVFAVWNGWALATIARHRTGLLPGSPSTTIIDRGPFARSRNPLYVGLLVGSAGVALVLASAWALAALPLEWALLRGGAVLPEERYLAGSSARPTPTTGRGCAVGCEVPPLVEEGRVLSRDPASLHLLRGVVSRRSQNDLLNQRACKPLGGNRRGNPVFGHAAGLPRLPA